MPGKYTVTGTSRATAIVQDIPLPSSDPEADKHTRRIARPQIVANRHDRKQSLKVSLIHQKKGRAGTWEDSPALNLATLKAGEEVRLHLDTSQTWHLYQALRDLFQVGPEHIPFGEQRLLVLDADNTRILQGKAKEVVAYFEQHGPHLWDVIDQMKPDLLDVAALHKLHETRRKVVAEFKEHVERSDWIEPDWQRFFEANTWIFGHSLNYWFLNTVQPQPHYGGVTLTGTGRQHGDMLLASEATVRFTVLVEIKKPNTALLDMKEYRTKVHRISGEMAGGVAQLQSNCRTWVLEGSRQEHNQETLGSQGIYTYEPKGMLVIGHCRQLDHPNKRAAFEVFRRNLHNPEVITYDELLARAEFLVSEPPKELGDVTPA